MVDDVDAGESLADKVVAAGDALAEAFAFSFVATIGVLAETGGDEGGVA